MRGEVHDMIINSRLQRELQIIQYLLKKRGHCEVRVDELVSLVNTSEGTVLSDINRINKNFAYLYINITSDGQVSLNCPDHVGLEYVYRKIMEESLEFQILEYLLTDPKQPLFVYIDRFFISESKFRRIISKWNRILSNRGLPVSISISPVVALQGDEMTIRKLYYRYLIEKYEADFHHNFFKKRYTLWGLVKRISSTYSIEVAHETKKKLSYWLYVCIQRMKNGYYMEKKRTETKKRIAQLLYNKISRNSVFTAQFSYENQVDFSVEVLFDLMETYGFGSLLSGEAMIGLHDHENEKTGLSLKAVRDFLFSFFDSVNYQDASFDLTAVAVHRFLNFIDVVQYFFYDPYRGYKEYIKVENPQFVLLFEKHVEESSLPDYIKGNNVLKDELLYYIVFYTKTILEKAVHLKNQKKIIILTTYYYRYVEWLKGMIERKFPGTVAVSFYQSHQLQFDGDYLEDFDLILTNYDDLPRQLEKRAIYLDVGVTPYFWRKLEKELKQNPHENIIEIADSR